MPSEALVEPPRRRFLDWRFLSALAALLMVALLVVGAWRDWEAEARADAERAALIAQLTAANQDNRMLRRQMTRIHRDAERAEKQARRQRAVLLLELVQLNRWLREHGVVVPVESSPAAGGVSRPGSTGDGGGGGSPPPPSSSPDPSDDPGPPDDPPPSGPPGPPDLPGLPDLPPLPNLPDQAGPKQRPGKP